MVAINSDYESGSGSHSTTQNHDSSTVLHGSGQSHIPKTVIIPLVIIAVALLVPLWLCMRKMRASERVTPSYRQEELVEKPKLCEVALWGSGRSSMPATFPESWRRLRPISIHQHSYQELKESKEPSSYRHSRTSRSISPSSDSKRSSSRHSRADSQASLVMSQLRVGVLITMPSPPLGGRRTPDDLVPMPDLCLGVMDVQFSGQPI